MSAQLKPRLRKRPCIRSARLFEQTIFVVDDLDALLDYIFDLKRTGTIHIDVLQGVPNGVRWDTHAESP